jgi:nucleoside-diphosphate-sugar epimerase
MKNIMIFGASGYIGRELVDCLYKDEQLALTLILKPGQSMEEDYSHERVKILFADVTDDESLSKIDYKVDTVVYLCGTKSKSLEHITKIYYEAPTAILKTIAESAEGTHFIMASNISVYGDHGNLIVDEESITKPNSPLGELIKQSERALLDRSKDISILRIPAVFGGEQKENIPSPVIIGEGENFMNFLWIEDLVEVIRQLVKYPLKGIFNLSDNYPISQKDAAAILAVWWNRTPHFISSEKAEKIFPENTMKILTNSIRLHRSYLLDVYHLTPLTLKQYIYREE